ncbi:MAG: hypothetical protein K2W85_00090 [Phycisphaerales bacterium]|nr:hypothetical protein [Phycisphaerales bacterium]
MSQMRVQRFGQRVGRSRVMIAAAMIGMACGLAGCELFGGKSDDGEKPEVASKPRVEVKPLRPGPNYGELARRYNLERVKHLDRLSARVNILLTYFDQDGERRTEDPEGRLQIIRPNKLAMNLGKAGQIVFWFGCDPEQYWWFDLSEKEKRIAATGRHENFTDETAQRIGLPIRPLDLIRVMGVVPLDPLAKGATQLSDDGKLVGVTSPIGDRGFQRMWLDPTTLRPTMIEVFDRQRVKVLVAEHEGEEVVEITRDIPGASLLRVKVPSRVLITHIATETTARITLTGCKDGPISDRAFDLPTLVEKYPVDRVIDLDAPRAPRGPSRSSSAR